MDPDLPEAFLKFRHFRRGQHDACGTHVLLPVSRVRGARNRNDKGFSRHEPGERNLSRGHASLSVCYPPQHLDNGLVAGESAQALSGRFPGSTLGPALARPVPLPGGGNDLYIQQDKFPAQFAADVRPAEARLMAATQRPIAESALAEVSGEGAWKTIPSWFIFGTLDKNIPPATQSFMAKRAAAKRKVEVKGASHVLMISHPAEVARLIQEAATAMAR